MKPTNYTAPSKARLMRELNISPETADTVRGLIRGEITTWDATRFPASNRGFAACYHKPRRVDRILTCLNEVLEMHGVEAIWGVDEFWPAAYYLNAGDTYIPTILFNRITGAFSLTCWGDFYERNQRRYSLR